MKKILRISFTVTLLLTTIKAFSQELTPQEVFKTCSPSIVDIYTYDFNDEELYQGSGVVIDTGIIATNYHVLSEARKYEIKKDTVSLGFAKLVAVNESKDIAILSIDSLDLPVIKFGSSSNLVVGENVYTIGNPLDLSNSFGNGIISGLRRDFDIMYDDMIQYSAITSPGSSGGALLNSKGELIGITTLGYEVYRGLNFAIPVSYYEEVLLNREYYSFDTLMLDLKYRMLAYVYEENYSNVEAVCNDLLEIDKYYPEAYYYRGNARYYFCDYDLALEDYNKLLEICPERSWTFYDTTKAGGKILNSYSNLVTGYTKEIEKDKTNHDLFMKRGVVYFLMSNFIAATRDFSEYLQFNESDYDAYYYRGVSNLYLKFTNDGVNDLRKALSLLLKIDEKPELRKTIEDILLNGIDINYSKKFFEDADSDETEPKAAIGN